MKPKLSLARFAFAVFMSATLCLPPRLSACEDTWEYDEWTTGISEYDTGSEHCVVTHWESQYYHCTSDGYGVNCNTQDHQYWDDTNCFPTGGGGDDPGPGGCDGESCSTCENPNHFTASNGNATRKIVDLEIAGASAGKLSWSRVHNTTPREAGRCYFGAGGSWRHNWQFDLDEIPNSATGSRPDYEFTSPSGIHRVFRSTADGQWKTASSFNEKLAVTGDGFDIETAGGFHLKFARVAGLNGKNRFEMRMMTDPYGLVTTLEYEESGLLTRVTEPAGRTIILVFKDYTFQSGRWTTLGVIKTVPAAGAWIDLKVPNNLNSVAFGHLRLSSPAGRPLILSDAQFFAADSAMPLTGTAKGTNASAEAAFDGKSGTAFHSKRGSVNLVGLDLGSAPGRIASIRVLAVPGHERDLVGVTVEGMVKGPETWPVVSRVEGSDGSSVSYDYGFTVDPISAQEHIALTQAHYGDSTFASYTYAYLTANQRPLLTDADDPRYVGRAKRIRYAYHDNQNFGMIHQEINPVTGGVYSSLELNPADPEQRVVRYSDLNEVSYKVPAETHNRATERIDSLGRKARFEYGEKGNGRLAAQIDHAERREEYSHDERGRLKSVVRKEKFDRKSERTANGRLMKTIDRRGRETTIDRDEKGRVARTRDSSGTLREFSYDSLGRLTSFKQRDGGVHKFVYDSRGLKTAWTDPLGRTTQFAYDARGRRVAMTDPVGRVRRRELNERGLTTKTIEPDGTTRQLAYDNYGRKMTETDELGRTTKYSYDELGRLVRTEDHVGRRTTYDYTDLPQGCGSCTLVDHPSRIVHADGMVEKMLYDSEGRLLARTIAADTPASATTTYAYDDENNLISTTDPLGRTTRHAYDDEDRRISTTDPVGRVTKWTYDNRDNVIEIVAPDGGVTTNDYDSHDRVISTKDAAGNITHYTYDDLGNRTSINDPAGRKTRFTYKDRFRTAAIYSDGKRETWDHDSLGRTIKTISPDNLETRTTYDAGGHILTIADSTGRKTAFIYDTIGRRLSATNPLGHVTRWTYDAHGNILTITRPDGAIVSNTYDLEDHLLTTTDAAGAITTYTYDPAGNQTSLTDARGNTYRFTYDVLHRKTSMVYPDGSQEKWTYDLAGNQSSSTTRAGQTKKISYNAVNQPVSETWSPVNAAPNVVYIYDEAGQLSSVNNGQVKLTYTYDQLGRPASETSDISALAPGLDPQTVKYTYDELGRRSGLAYPNQTKTSYDYDARGRLKAIDLKGGGRTPVATYDYDQVGRVAKLTRDNGVATSYTYDMAGQLTEISHNNGAAVLASSRYVLDSLGRRIAQTREDNTTETYRYDINGQLTFVDYGNARRENFAYDQVGNRMEATPNGLNPSSSSTRYTSNGLNQYTQVSVGNMATRLTYDANGNLTSDGKQTYVYDAQNRLISVTSVSGFSRPDSVHAEFFYDSRNRCVLRRYYSVGSQRQWVQNQTESRALIYDMGWNLLAERRLDGSQVSAYVHGLRIDDILRAEVLAPQASSLLPTYPLADGIGSTVALADRKGRVSERVRYNVSGEPTALNADYSPSAAGSIPACRFLFSGREWLGKVGLNDHRFRCYSPSLGRWNTPDPIKFFGDNANIYRYANNSIVNFQDPFGLRIEEVTIPTNISTVHISFIIDEQGCTISHDKGSDDITGWTGLLVEWASITTTDDAVTSESCGGGKSKKCLSVLVKFYIHWGVGVEIGGVSGGLVEVGKVERWRETVTRCTSCCSCN